MSSGGRDSRGQPGDFRPVVWLAGVGGLLALLIVFAGLASGTAGLWVDPPAPPNSLARDAARKLSAWVTADMVPRSSVAVPSRPYIVIDTHTNRLYWRTADRVLFSMLCSTGTGAELRDPDQDRSWRFDTPRGVFAVNALASDPLWRKPDWAFIEDGVPIPEHADDRLDAESLGAYSIGFGDGYYIHGTIYERLIGVAVTHGCVRLAAVDLEMLYDHIEMGTMVVVF